MSRSLSLQEGSQSDRHESDTFIQAFFLKIMLLLSFHLSHHPKMPPTTDGNPSSNLLPSSSPSLAGFLHHWISATFYHPLCVFIRNLSYVMSHPPSPFQHFQWLASSSTSQRYIFLHTPSRAPENRSRIIFFGSIGVCENHLDTAWPLPRG